METTEKIVEAYVRYVKGWATIPNIKCDRQLEIDLLAIDPLKSDRYHIESSVSSSQVFSKLTGKKFDPALLNVRVQRPAMRRTVGYFCDHKFGAKPVIDKLRQYGLEPGSYKKIIVSWGWTPDAEVEAKAAEIELLDFQFIIHEIVKSMREARGYFTDDTLRTINLFVRATAEADAKDKKSTA